MHLQGRPDGHEEVDLVAVGDHGLIKVVGEFFAEKDNVGLEDVVGLVGVVVSVVGLEQAGATAARNSLREDGGKVRKGSEEGKKHDKKEYKTR